MNPRVKQILNADPFVVTAVWTDEKIRSTDFGAFLAEYFEKEDSIYFKILQPKTFAKAKTDGRTIYWDDIAEMRDYNGKLIPAPLDFDPDVLFGFSEIIDT